jgi:hypothetical protein
MSQRVSPRGAEVVEADGVGPERRATSFRVGFQRVAALPAELSGPVGRATAFHSDALKRTAALLIVLSRNNGYEGRDPALIADDLSCGLVADMLGIGIDALADVLVDLERRRLVANDEGGLRLTDIDALDRLSEGQLHSISRQELFEAHA